MVYRQTVKSLWTVVVGAMLYCGKVAIFYRKCVSMVLPLICVWLVSRVLSSTIHCC